MGKVLLITGGCGFIGSNFIRTILRKYPEYKIINVDKLTYASCRETLHDLEQDLRYMFVQADICCEEILDPLVARCDIIVHFAAESHVDRSILTPQEFVMTNVLGTLTLLQLALRHGKKRFHHISTDEVFGSLSEGGKFHEKTPYDPRSPYSASKAASDHLVRAYFHTYGLPITISNCSNNYGPYQFPEKFIPLFITNLLEGKKIPLYGTGQNVRDWIYVDDHNEAVDLILHHGMIGETYCLGGNAEKSNLEVARMILSHLGVPGSRIDFVPDRKGHDFRYAMDFSKIEKELRWKPRYTFSEGLNQTIAWYKEYVWWWKPLKERVISDITSKQ